MPMNFNSTPGIEFGKLDKVVRYAAFATPLVTYGVRKYRNWQANQKYTITVNNDSDLYYVLEDWLQNQLPETDHRFVSISVKEGSLVSFFDSDMVQTIYFNDHPVEVSLTQNARKKRVDENSAIPDGAGSDGYFSEFKRRKITLVAQNIEGKEAVISQLKELAKKFDRGTWLWTLNQWSDWSNLGRVPNRPLESVILPEGKTEKILQDAQLFLSSKDKYDMLGIPWHRGYLFHGPPGSGKTSLAKMLASELGMNLYYIPLSSIKNDSDLGAAISRIGNNSILLMEDIDVVHAAKKRNDEQKGITLSGLLNALDGVITPPGLITIMTTNNKEILDPALIRAGRIDVDEEISYLTDEQLNKLCFYLLGLNLDLSLKGSKITSSEVIEIFKANLHDNDSIIDALQSRWR